jgi:hypothetical protein
MKTLIGFVLALLAFILLGNAVLPLYFDHPLFDRNPAIDLTFCDQIDAEQPDLVVIGNSLIERGIDFEQLSAASGLQAMRMSSGGSGSALWYLFLKNEILTAEHPPRYVAIVFRDNTFSVPNLSVEGKYAAIIDQFAGADEPLLDQLAYLNYLSPWQRFLEENIAWFRYNPAVRDGLVDAFRTPLVSGLFGVDGLTIDGAVNRAFAPEKLDPALATRAQQAADPVAEQIASNYDFYANLDTTFLPPLIDLANEHGIQLIFVSYRARHYVEYPELSRTNDAYIADLRAYVEEHGVIFLDFAHDQRLTIEHFAEGDHLNGDGRILFTDLLAAELRAIDPD